jgi:hypothetical protein
MDPTSWQTAAKILLWPAALAKNIVLPGTGPGGQELP